MYSVVTGFIPPKEWYHDKKLKTKHGRSIMKLCEELNM